jgi:hypothetical protein
VDGEIARRQPFYLGLDSEPSDAELIDYRPLVNTAQTLSARRWSSTSDHLRLDWIRRCPPKNRTPPGNARCVPISRVSKDPMAERLRFLAWPLANALVFSGPPQRVRQACRELRDNLLGSALMGLVLCASKHPIPPPLTNALNRAEKLYKRQPSASALSVWLRTRGTLTANPLQLDERTLVVIPRLSALAQWGTLSTEVYNLAKKYTLVPQAASQQTD